MNLTSIHESILNNMSDAVYVIDLGMRIRYANPAAHALTGYSVEETIGKFCHEIFCEKSSRCEEQCPPKEALRRGTPILYRDAETRTKTGEVRQTQISFSALMDNGACTGTIIVMKDITDLKRAEERIRMQTRFLTSVINALPHPFYVIDAETYEIKLANNAAYQGTLPECPTCHQLSHKIAQPCNSADHPCPLEKVKETGQPVTMEHRHCTAGDACRDVEVHGYPIFDDNGKVVQMIEYCIDISDRNQAARDREVLIADLRKALHEVKTLSGLLPICSSCKKIRDDQGYWKNLEMYISEHSGAEFSHGICPDCAQ
ncbi:MAG TPA: PAS domain-containing protein, partial [Nitrospirota bacterium]